MTPYYEQDGITIYHGDCREVLPSVQFDVVLTDPPYGISWAQIGTGKTAKTLGMRTHQPIIGDDDVSVRDAALAMIGCRPALVFGSFYAPFPPGVVQVLVYQKTPDAGLVGSVNGFRRDAEPIFLLGDWPSLNARWSSVVASRIGLQALTKPGFHPHAKPLDVLFALLLAMPGGVAADPFMGSGSMLVAAKRQGRKAIGIEIEERHCETAVRRLAQGALPMEFSA